MNQADLHRKQRLLNAYRAAWMMKPKVEELAKRRRLTLRKALNERKKSSMPV